MDRHITSGLSPTGRDMRAPTTRLQSKQGVDVLSIAWVSVTSLLFLWNVLGLLAPPILRHRRLS